jgi:hypothetical protein
MKEIKSSQAQGRDIVYSLIGALVLFALYLPEFILLGTSCTSILHGRIPFGMEVQDRLILFFGLPLVLGIGVLYCLLGGFYTRERRSKMMTLLYCVLLAGGTGSFIHAVTTLMLLKH